MNKKGIHQKQILTDSSLFLSFSFHMEFDHTIVSSWNRWSFYTTQMSPNRDKYAWLQAQEIPYCGPNTY